MFKIEKVEYVDDIPFDDEKNYYCVLISSKTCNPCKVVKSMIEKYELEDEVIIYEVDGFKDREFVEGNKIFSAPTFAILNKKRTVLKTINTVDITTLKDFYNDVTGENISGSKQFF